MRTHCSCPSVDRRSMLLGLGVLALSALLLGVPVACGPPPPPEAKGCAETKLYQNDPNPAKRGPWAVGARTVKIAGLTVEVWYPAQWNSQIDQSPIRYDLRKQLPPKEQNKIPDDKNPWQLCDCYRDLPLDTNNGPYPVVLFIHGTAGFRTQSLTHTVHWASRGFVVLSADHPGLRLGDVLQFKLNANQAADAKAILKALLSYPGGLAGFKGGLDLTRIAVVGHSAGGSALRDLGAEPNVQVLIPMASGGANVGKSLKSTLVLGGTTDKVVPYSRQQKGYEDTTAKARLVGIEKAGHLAFADLCVLGKEQGGIFQIAIDNGVEIDPTLQNLIGRLANDGCTKDNLAIARGWEIIHYASSATLEETLHCRSDMTQKLAQIKSTYPEVKEYKEKLK